MALKTGEKFLRLAIQTARKGIKEGQTPFGACIVRKGKVVALAHNLVWKKKDLLAYAEMNAIHLACRKLKTIDLSDCELYSTCEPCPMCFSAVHWARIRTVFFGAWISDAKKAGFNELLISAKTMKRLGKSRTKVFSGFLEKECRSLFLEWEKQKNKKAY